MSFKDNPYWNESIDEDGRRCWIRKDDGFTEYALDPVIANRVKELRLGLNGWRQHSWRAVAIACAGYEDQMTGKDLCRLAAETLNEDWD